MHNSSPSLSPPNDGLSQLTETEIYKELEPHGIAHAKRFISRETGPEVNLNTFLIIYSTHNIPISIRIGHYNARKRIVRHRDDFSFLGV
jgi:hypothetical protein